VVGAWGAARGVLRAHRARAPRGLAAALCARRADPAPSPLVDLARRSGSAPQLRDGRAAAGDRRRARALRPARARLVFAQGDTAPRCGELPLLWLRAGSDGASAQSDPECRVWRRALRGPCPGATQRVARADPRIDLGAAPALWAALHGAGLDAGVRLALLDSRRPRVGVCRARRGSLLTARPAAPCPTGLARPARSAPRAFGVRADLAA
jgi:hypothetical protein